MTCRPQFLRQSVLTILGKVCHIPWHQHSRRQGTVWGSASLQLAKECHLWKKLGSQDPRQHGPPWLQSPRRSKRTSTSSWRIFSRNVTKSPLQSGGYCWKPKVGSWNLSSTVPTKGWNRIHLPWPRFSSWRISQYFCHASGLFWRRLERRRKSCQNGWRDCIGTSWQSTSRNCRFVQSTDIVRNTSKRPSIRLFECACVKSVLMWT